METNFDIFISYGHDEHAEVAKRIKEDLEAEGFNVWFDKGELREGDDWENAIEKGLLATAQARGKVLFIITPHSARRPDGYCLNELSLAIQRRIEIIPLLLKEQAPPLSICRLQFLDLRDVIRENEIIEGRYKRQFGLLLKALKTPGLLESEGAQSYLLKTLKPINFEADIRLFVRNFIGRKWLMDEVTQWMHDLTNRKIFWISGPPGTGKSAFAAHIKDTQPEIIGYHFCDANSQEKRDAKRLVCTIAYQLSTQLGGQLGQSYRQALAKMDLDNDIFNYDAYTLFDRLIVEPLSMESEGEKNVAVIIIDAVDEATIDGRNEIVTFLRNKVRAVPSWLKFLITSRPEPEITSGLQAYEPVILDVDSESNEYDLAAYLARRLPHVTLEQRELILDYSEGIFLYVNEVCEEILRGEVHPDQVDQLPRNIGELFAITFDRKFENRHSEYKEKIKPFLEMLLASYEPLPLPTVIGLVGYEEEDLDEIQDSLGALFRKSGEFYLPFHKSMVDWLTNRQRAGRWTVYLKKGHRVLAEKLLGTERKEVQDYKAHFLGYHLYKCGVEIDCELAKRITHDFVDSRGQNALQFAILDRRLDIAGYLLEAGVDPDAADVSGARAVHLAAKNGDRDALEILFQNKADLTALDGFEMSAMHYAAMNGHNGVLEYLLSQGSSIEARNQIGMTPAHFAAASGKSNTLSFLNNCGAELAAENSYGDAVLRYAVRHNRLGAVRFLHGQGINLRTQGRFGSSPIDLIEAQGYEELKGYFLSQGVEPRHGPLEGSVLSDSLPEVFKAAIIGDLRRLDKAVSACRDYGELFNGTTILHHAAARGHVHVVDYLIQSGFDVDKPDANEETAIYAATWARQRAVIENLLRKNASIEVHNVNGFSLLHVVSRVGDLALFKNFIELGLDHGAKDKRGLTPLHFACRGGHLPAVKLLVELGADVNAKGENGLSVAFMAAVEGSIETIEFLERNGADLDARDIFGWGLLFEAVSDGNLPLVRYLVGRGVDTNAKTTSGASPLAIADIYGRTDVAEYLRGLA